MKLIALVVEKYKDVFEKQIFNFSDEFRVDFDFNNRKLSIKENEDYIPDFYGKSIYNITPIVGINGSGKTSLIECFSQLDSNNTKFCLIYLDEENKLKCLKQENFVLENSISEKIDNYGKTFKEKYSEILDDIIFFEQFRKKVLNHNDNPQQKRTFHERSIVATDYFIYYLLKAYDILKRDGIVNSKFGITLKLKNVSELPNQLQLNTWTQKNIIFESKIDNDNTSIITITDYSGELVDFFEKLKQCCMEKKMEKKIEIFESDIEFHTSLGEEQIIRFIALLIFNVDHIQNDRTKLYIIDEIESSMHLEWSRRLINFLIKFIQSLGGKQQIQFIFTTHSPYMLSDIKPGNIIALKKNDSGHSEVQPYQNTFAKNIQEIMHDDMFISNIYGEFAVQKINKMINHLNCDDKYDEEQQYRLKKEILLISEPLIRDKLLDMYHAKYTDEETGKEDEILRLIAGLSEERKAQILEKLDRQQKNL